MPWGVYNAARLFVCDWRNKSISKVRSEAGKKGQEAKRASKEGQATINTKKKGKQGRVKKQTDKRLGSQVDKKIIGKRKKRPLT